MIVDLFTEPTCQILHSFLGLILQLLMSLILKDVVMIIFRVLKWLTITVVYNNKNLTLSFNITDGYLDKYHMIWLLWYEFSSCVMDLFVSYRLDYIPHPYSKPAVHQSEQWQQPMGNFDHLTNYTKDYPSK